MIPFQRLEDDLLLFETASRADRLRDVLANLQGQLMRALLKTHQPAEKEALRRQMRANRQAAVDLNWLDTEAVAAALQQRQPSVHTLRQLEEAVAEPAPEAFRLDTETFEAFVEEIIGLIVRPCPPQASPWAVFIGGQSGAGKTLVAADLLARLPDALLINSDDLRTMHPYYEKALLINQERASVLVQADTSAVMKRVIEAAIAKKCHVILDGTLAGRQMQTIRATMHDFIQAGYQIQVALMGVHQSISKLSMLYRYVQQVAQQGHGRWVSYKTHENQYEQIPINVAELVESGLPDEYLIYWRKIENGRLNRGAILNPALVLIRLSEARLPPYGPELERMQELRGELHRQTALLGMTPGPA